MRRAVCKIEDVPTGGMHPVDLEGLPSIVIFNLDAEYYATSNICTHAVSRLSDGFFEDGQIECPLHSGCFDVKTGKATEFPCELPLRTFKVEVEGDNLVVEFGDS